MRARVRAAEQWAPNLVPRVRSILCFQSAAASYPFLPTYGVAYLFFPPLKILRVEGTSLVGRVKYSPFFSVSMKKVMVLLRPFQLQHLRPY